MNNSLGSGSRNNTVRDKKGCVLKTIFVAVNRLIVVQGDSLEK